MTSIQHACIICLGNNPVSISSIPFLTKKCNCKIQTHPTCIEQWIKNKPVCPICGERIYYKELIIEESESESESSFQKKNECIQKLYTCVLIFIIIIIIIRGLMYFKLIN
jgi:hypothetical protein